MSKRTSKDDVDSDLADLLHHQDGRSQPHEHGTKPMNLDHVTQGKQEFDRSNVSKPRSSRMQNLYRDYGYNNGHSGAYGTNGGGKASVLTTAIDYLAAYISIMCYYYPNVGSCLAILAVVLILFFLANLILNPSEEFGVIHHDFTTIRSKYDASVAKIDHWCLEGGDTNCDCEDPLTPISRMEHLSWVEAVQYNRKLVQHYTTQPPLDGTGKSIPSKTLEPDVVFLGGDIVEEMDGRWMGDRRSSQLRTLEIMFKNHFHKQPDGAKVDGVALGVAGDTAPNVLFRLLHGEMPDDFNPKIWWITLGMNELGRMKCSEEVVVLGILRVVEEIMERKPNARIVINSLFPMVSMRGDPYPLISDYQDSFENGADQNKRGWRNNGKSEEDEGEGGNRHRQLAEARLPDRGSSRFGEDARVRGRPDSFSLKGPMSPHERSEEAERIRVAIAERRKRMGIFRRNPRDPINPRLDPNRKKIHKFVPGTLHLKKRKLPLWTSIRAINKQLETFAMKNDRVTFFDVTRLFSSRRDDGTSSLSSKLITARGHPTERGYAIYEDEIAKEVTKIIAEMKRKQPELFPEESDVQNQKATYDESKFYHDDIDTDDVEMFFEEEFDPFSGGSYAEQMDDMVGNDEGSQADFGEPEGWNGGGGVNANEEKDDEGWNGDGGGDGNEERNDEGKAVENAESTSSWEGAEVSVERTESADQGNTNSDMAGTEKGGENEGKEDNEAEEDVTTDTDEDQDENVGGDGEDEDDDDDDDNAGDEGEEEDEEDDDDDNVEEEDEEADDDNEQADDADDDDDNAEEDDVEAGEEDEEDDDNDDDQT